MWRKCLLSTINNMPIYVLFRIGTCWLMWYQKNFLKAHKTCNTSSYKIASLIIQILISYWKWNDCTILLFICWIKNIDNKVDGKVNFIAIKKIVHNICNRASFHGDPYEPISICPFLLITNWPEINFFLSEKRCWYSI